MNIRVAGKYRLGKKIGKGSFGVIYYAYDVDKNLPVAVKLELKKNQIPQLIIESRMYRRLGHLDILPRLDWFGCDGDYYALVMELMGSSLEDLFTLCQQKFSLKTVLILADQMIKILNLIHENQVIHRDIKPDNFVMGHKTSQNSKNVNIIDFGLSKVYIDPRTKKHSPCFKGKELIGTARYASINNHHGLEQSRRDDVESLGYVLIYFLKSQLPWQGLIANNRKQKYEKICERKVSTTAESLCYDLPDEFLKYVKYSRSLWYEEQPDYDYLRKMFRNLMIRMSLSDDRIYDWDLLTESQSRITLSSINAETDLMNNTSNIQQTCIKKMNNGFHQMSLTSHNNSTQQDTRHELSDKDIDLIKNNNLFK